MVDPQMVVALCFLISAALMCVYAGSKRLLSNVKHGSTDETLHQEDAAAFPLNGSCALFGLYTALKFIPKYVISSLISGYISLMSIFALGALLRSCFGQKLWTGVLSVAMGCIYHISQKHWICNNVLAFAVCVVAIGSVPISNFKTSAILLIGLFFYDIFWVFFTDVMVSVALNIDGPIKLLFPQTIFGAHNKLSLLGLGDIVIPGFFISQTLVFSELVAKRGSFYFKVALVAYFFALVNAMVVMMVFHHAQPVLLYIVPWLLISTTTAAAARGDLRALFQFELDDIKNAEAAKKPKKSVKKCVDDDEVGIVGLLWFLVRQLFGYGEEDDEDVECALSNGQAPSSKATGAAAKKNSETKMESRPAAATVPKKAAAPASSSVEAKKNGKKSK